MGHRKKREVATIGIGRCADKGVDVNYWRGAPSPIYRREGFRNLIYVGRLEDRNGPDLALAAPTSACSSLAMAPCDPSWNNACQPG